jgi:hypothetical protein
MGTSPGRGMHSPNEGRPLDGHSPHMCVNVIPRDAIQRGTVTETGGPGILLNVDRLGPNWKFFLGLGWGTPTRFQLWSDPNTLQLWFHEEGTSCGMSGLREGPEGPGPTLACAGMDEVARSSRRVVLSPRLRLTRTDLPPSPRWGNQNPAHPRPPPGLDDPPPGPRDLPSSPPRCGTPHCIAHHGPSMGYRSIGHHLHEGWTWTRPGGQPTQRRQL